MSLVNNNQSECESRNVVPHPSQQRKGGCVYLMMMYWQDNNQQKSPITSVHHFFLLLNIMRFVNSEIFNVSAEVF